MNLPHALIQAAASYVLPGCFYYHGEAELANIKLDQTTAADRIVYLDDKMPFRFVTTKYGQLTGTTYSCLLMLLVPSKLADTSAVREPRVAAMVDAAARMVQALSVHPDVASVKLTRPADVLFNQFDRNADGVALYFDLTPRGGLNVCLPPNQSQV
ncbi:hypothetical protein QMK33_19775 [Hymenobacter sp. H14-R3]|uniref:hypothetical protein n=1 Tax=Hymenobacter sp. H14-R3 TaxID=3046308 RepID=UPI0024B8FD8B|nr:hypothetical protein [Hymenobacter sp. H14-R3]MDJ0367394.1 hypothetical protein [Hymenobacter sp. H14-R3]